MVQDVTPHFDKRWRENMHILEEDRGVELLRLAYTKSTCGFWLYKRLGIYGWEQRVRSSRFVQLLRVSPLVERLSEGHRPKFRLPPIQRYAVGYPLNASLFCRAQLIGALPSLALKPSQPEPCNRCQKCHEQLARRQQNPHPSSCNTLTVPRPPLRTSRSRRTNWVCVRRIST